MGNDANAGNTAVRMLQLLKNLDATHLHSIVLYEEVFKPVQNSPVYIFLCVAVWATWLILPFYGLLYTTTSTYGGNPACVADGFAEFT